MEGKRRTPVTCSVIPAASETVVQLYRAGIPLLGWIAAHYWFVVRDADRCERWEVWQRPNAGGRAIGHLHCNLKPPEAHVGGGPTVLLAEWRGEEAERLRRVLVDSERYPFCRRYRYWPGPNSNTFVAWVFRQARIEYPLGRLALGKNYSVS
jgi:hypothetical protein